MMSCPPLSNRSLLKFLGIIEICLVGRGIETAAAKFISCHQPLVK